MTNLRPHQARFLKKNPNKALLAWEMRVGKTLPASIWIDMPERSGNTYIICPKQIKKDWERMGTKATILSKEEFKKADIQKPTAIVVDESHYFGSPLFIKGRSQLATALYTLIYKNPECHVLLLTATPIRQDAWSLHTLLCYIGVYIPWKQYRERFFVLKRMPFLKYPIWVPTNDWRKGTKEMLEKYADIVSLQDCVAYLPPATIRLITIKQKPYRKPLDEEVNWTHEHRFEQQGKAEEILKLGYKKLIVVAHYTLQIDELAEALGKEKPVFVLDGRTKDADAVKKEAQEAEECYFLLQSSMGFGFQGFMFGAIVFASQSHSHVNHTQMLGRTRSVDHLEPVEYIYLQGGRWDRRIYKTLKEGATFNPHKYKD